MLSEKELNEPEIPYRFAKFLLDFLAHPGHNQTLPPQALSGQYRALRKSTEITRRVELTLDVRDGDHVIRVSESSATWSSSVLTTSYHAHGWAIITPEDNLFMFIKNDRYGYNHYYFTIALHPSIWSDTSVRELSLLRHQYPVLRECDSTYLPGLMKETDDDTAFFLFKKIEDPWQTGKGDSDV
jgi:hypothetical protein